MPTSAEIKEYWDHKADELRDDPSATMKDVILRSLEIEAIASRLDPRDHLLDVGCGNAYGSVIFSEHCQRVLAIDYSDKMILTARHAIAESGRKNIRAAQGDVLDLGDLSTEPFTAVSCVRCLINLPNEDQQYSALSQLARALVSRGRLFLVEGIAEHFAAMNANRQQLGLAPIALNWHNRLFAKAGLEKAIKRDFVIDEIVDFGEYYFLSRLVHPLLSAPEEPRFEGALNHVAKSIWQAGIAKGIFTSQSTLLLYVCRKR